VGLAISFFRFVAWPSISGHSERNRCVLVPLKMMLSGIHCSIPLRPEVRLELGRHTVRRAGRIVLMPIWTLRCPAARLHSVHLVTTKYLRRVGVIDRT
jgi:hypothetical protein